MTPSYRTSVKGTLLSTGEDTRNRILAALPSSAAEIARQFGIPKSTARYVLGKLLVRGVVRLVEKRVVGKSVAFIYAPAPNHTPLTSPWHNAWHARTMALS